MIRLPKYLGGWNTSKTEGSYFGQKYWTSNCYDTAPATKSAWLSLILYLVPYLDDYWSNPFGPKYDPSVLEVVQLLKYFGNFTIFISYGISKKSKTSVISHGNTTMHESIWINDFRPLKQPAEGVGLMR